jgi:hypothetical protein
MNANDWSAMKLDEPLTATRQMTQCIQSRLQSAH